MIHILPLLEVISNQGLTIAYVDFDPIRRQLASSIKGVIALEPKLVCGPGMMHVNVLFTVNEHEFDPRVLNEFRAIPAYMASIYPTFIRIEL